MARYKYKPLETPTSIRLIELMASDDEDSPLRCRIFHIDIKYSPHPEYAALSYVWGDESNPSTIICDEGTELSITRNLDIALRTIRLASGNPVWHNLIWADAICIDQEDATGEKEVQIPLMGKIYSEAFVVFAWLGGESQLKNAHAALECMDELISNVHPRIEELRNWTVRFNDIEELVERGSVVRESEAAISQYFDIPPLGSQGYKALNEILNVSWFRRVWTFQEGFLAQKRWFMIGKVVVSGEVMINIINILTLLGQKTTLSPGTYIEGRIMPNICRVVGHIPDFVRRDSISFLTLLRGSACKLPSDMVYSLFGLVETPPAIQVDYDKPFGQVFAESAVECIMSSQRLTVLGLVDVLEWSESSPVPSWVPDWRNVSSCRTFSTPNAFFRTHKRIYACTGSSKPCLTPLDDARELHIRGVEFDRMCAVASSEIDGLLLKVMVSEFPTVFPGGSNIYLPTGEKADSAGIRTKCADLRVFDEDEEARISARWKPDSEFRFMEMFSNPTTRTHVVLKMMEFGKTVSLFATERGRLGSANPNIREGDIICLMMGGDVPLVLRADPQDEGRYTFVGECYLHGFMDGEGLVEARSEADPSYDPSERSWLEQLHECESLPFSTREFRIR